MKIGGLDVSKACTGWATIEGEQIRFGVWKPTAKSDGLIIEEFRANVRTWVLVNKIDVVGIEAALMQVGGFGKSEDDLLGGAPQRKAMTSPKILFILHALNMVAQGVCESLNVPWHPVAVQSHRKSFLGAGKIPKGQGKVMTRDKLKMMGIAVKSLDACDAISICWHAAGIHKQHLMTGADLFRGK